MARINLYAQNRHTLIVDGVAIQGFAEGDFLSVKQDGNAAARTQGADGPSMNISSAQGGNITIELQPTSPALGQLYALREQQLREPRMFSIVLVSGVDETINAAGCAFGEQPQFATGGPTMQGRQFSIEALQIKMDTSETGAVEGGLLPAV